MAAEISPEIKKTKNYLADLRVALLIFTLASGVVFAALPQFFKINDPMATFTTPPPPFVLLLLAGLIGVAITTLFLWYVNRLGLGLSKSALVLSLGYGSVIAVTKLTVVPWVLYVANSQNTFEIGLFDLDPNQPMFYMVTALLVIFLYLVVFRIMYVSALRRFNKAVGGQAQKKSIKTTTKNSIFAALILIGLLAVCGALFFGSLSNFPAFIILVVGSLFDYFKYLFSALGILIIIALLLAIFLAKTGFNKVGQQAIATRNASLLASFFWVGVSLIFLYHIMWIVFLLALVQIWPFRTYTPK